MAKERSGERASEQTTLPVTRPQAAIAAAAPGSGGGTPSFKWDSSGMRNSYANVINVAGTREEIVLLFGIHNALQSGVKEVVVQLQDRIMVTPYTAKRLHLLLGHVLREFESRYGPLNVDSRGHAEPAESLPSR